MIANHSTEIKIAIFHSVWKHQRYKWRSSSNCGRIAAKIAHLNSVNSEIIGWKFTKFGYDVAWLLPLNILKADLRSANLMSNAEAKAKGPCYVFEHLRNLTGLPQNLCQFYNPHTCDYLCWKADEHQSSSCWGMDDDRQIEAKLQHNFHLLSCSLPKLLDRSSPKFYTI